MSFVLHFLLILTWRGVCNIFGSGPRFEVLQQEVVDYSHAQKCLLMAQTPRLYGEQNMSLDTQSNVTIGVVS